MPSVQFESPLGEETVQCRREGGVHLTPDGHAAQRGRLLRSYLTPYAVEDACRPEFPEPRVQARARGVGSAAEDTSHDQP